MDGKKVHQDFRIRWIIAALCLALLWALPVLAEDITPHTVNVFVVDQSGQPASADSIGCAWSDYPVPTNYTSTVQCTNCSQTTCVFSGTMEPAEGAYIVSEDFYDLEQSPTSAAYGQTLVGSEWQVFGLWYTNEAAPGFDWEATHVVTFVLSLPPTPTPTPTVTPTPTATPLPTPTPQATMAPQLAMREMNLAPNDEVHVNSPEAGIMSGELPAPLPSMPRRVIMPDLNLPYIDFSDWPTVSDGRAGLAEQINQRLYVQHAMINEQYNRAREGLNAVKSTTRALREFVGNPVTSITSQSDTRVVTVNSMAAEMAQSVEYSIGYLRAVSNLGPMGLDLVFIFIGLGWVLFMNVLEWLVLAIAWILKMIAGAINFVLRIIELIMDMIRTIRALLLL